MIAKNLSLAKSQLSHLVNSALAGKEVVICKDSVPVVRLVPIHTMSAEDPCRFIPELSVSVEKDEILRPLSADDWGALLK